ncbi:hypothetical protein [Saccharospirillum impatiens]|uniref:hypothetical protein n=1 Tax=Saccharospirillum impatiens TaxID=169438 RepID=UPI00040B83A0|nr:hypothetical protein [Saccharospirillum impatiens]
MSGFTPLPEASRQHYLEAMGIDSWYPRVRLPAAPAPLIFDLDDTDYPTSPADSAGPGDARAVPAPIPTPEERPTADATEPLSTGSATAAEPRAETAGPPVVRSKAAPVPRFALSLSVVGDYLIADTLARGLSQPTDTGQQLLLNILATLGVGAADVRTHHVVQWPLFTNRKVDQGLDQARVYVDEKLDQFIRQYQPSMMLSFGAVMPKLQGWQQPQGDYGDVPWVGLPSLYQMLNEPMKKAICWHRLKPLIQSIDRNA